MRVAWGRYSGEDVEHVIAMMLCRRFQTATRIRPSTGDGGVDVLVATETGFAVWQVKKFADNLGSSQKAQIKDSIDRLRKFAQDRVLAVTEWHLVMPLDPTHENREWLEELLRNDDFAHSWHGLVYVDGLAAEFPEVIDYYLRDGKDRLDASLQRFASAMSLLGAQAPLQPGDAHEGLAGIFQTLNELDPLYRYEFDVSDTWRKPSLSPNLVFATTTMQDGAYVTFRVYERCAESTLERPIEIKTLIPIQEHPELHRRIEDFFKYGIGFTTPAVAEVDTKLPGGLGGTFSKAIIQFGDNSDDDVKSFPRRFQAIAPDGTVAAEAKVNMFPASVGIDRTGFRTIADEVNGVFSCELLGDLSGQAMSIKVTPHDVAGRLVAEVIDGVRLLDQLGEPNRLRICHQAGPAVHAPIPEMFAPNDNPILPQFVEDLLTIQEHTPVQITVPEERELTTDLLRDVDEAARLLRGEEIVSYLKSTSANMSALNADLPEGPRSFVIDQDFAVKLNGEVIELGRRRSYFPIAEARFEPVNDGNSVGTVHLTPVPGQRLERMMTLAPRWNPTTPIEADPGI
jgi:hypothetical protein